MLSRMESSLCETPPAPTAAALDSKAISKLNSEEDMNTYDDNHNEFDYEEGDRIPVNLEEELELLNEAYYNAYLIATEQTTLNELLKSSEDLFLVPFDPEVPESLKLILDDVIEYFSNQEEYEKCAELIKVKEKLNDV